MIYLFSRSVVALALAAAGVLALVAAVLAMALGLAAVRADSTKEPFFATFDQSFCEVVSSIANPSTIGMQGRFDRLVSATDDGLIRFTSLPDRWRQICLTSIDSGIALPRGAKGDDTLFQLRSEICWGWSPDSITAFLFENASDTYPVQLKVSRKIGGRSVSTDYTDLRVPAGFSLCATRHEAIAECVASSMDSYSCTYLFRAK